MGGGHYSDLHVYTSSFYDLTKLREGSTHRRQVIQILTGVLALYIHTKKYNLPTIDHTTK